MKLSIPEPVNVELHGGSVAVAYEAGEHDVKDPRVARHLVALGLATEVRAAARKGAKED